MGELEGIDDVVDLRDSSRRHGYGNDIKAGRFILKIVVEKILLGGSAYLYLFFQGDRFGGIIGGAGLPGLDLDEDQDFAISGNYIDFAKPLPVISKEDGITLFLQIPGCQILPFFAEHGTFLRQIPSPLEKSCDVRDKDHNGRWPVGVLSWDSLYCGRSCSGEMQHATHPSGHPVALWQH